MRPFTALILVPRQYISCFLSTLAFFSFPLSNFYVSIYYPLLPGFLPVVDYQLPIPSKVSERIKEYWPYLIVLILAEIRSKTNKDRL